MKAPPEQGLQTYRNPIIICNVWESQISAHTSNAVITEMNDWLQANCA